MTRRALRRAAVPGSGLRPERHARTLRVRGSPDGEQCEAQSSTHLSGSRVVKAF